MDNDIKKYKKKWFGYFDLLGFSNLVQHQEISDVLRVYKEVIKLLKDDEKAERLGISYSWFSDTFIVYTRGASLKEFARIEHFCRMFFQRLILRSIPVRGSLSVGLMYTNRKQHTYIGPALIEAYHYGEDPNWIGFVLTPSVSKELAATEIPIEKRSFYRSVPKEVQRKLDYNGAFAFAFNNGSVNGQNPYLASIRDMETTAPTKGVKLKYKNTIDFLMKHSY